LGQIKRQKAGEIFRRGRPGEILPGSVIQAGQPPFGRGQAEGRPAGRVQGGEQEPVRPHGQGFKTEKGAAAVGLMADRAPGGQGPQVFPPQMEPAGQNHGRPFGSQGRLRPPGTGGAASQPDGQNGQGRQANQGGP